MGEILKADFVNSEEHFSKDLLYKLIDLCALNIGMAKKKPGEK